LDDLLYHKAEGFVNKVRSRFRSYLVTSCQRLGEGATWKAVRFFEERLSRIVRLAQGIEQHKDELLVAAAEDAGFPVRVTAVEVDLAVEHLRSMREEIRGLRVACRLVRWQRFCPMTLQPWCWRVSGSGAPDR